LKRLGSSPAHRRRDRKEVNVGATTAYRWIEREDGQALVEYALIILLVSTVVVLSLTAIGGAVDAALLEVVDDL
jgi:Flp pilus assembly pilin Flp